VKNKREAKKIKPLRVGAVGSLALLCSKFAQSFHAQNRITGIASTKSLEKIKTCRRSRKIEALFFTKFAFRFSTKFGQRFLQIEETNRLEVGFKISGKVEQISTARLKSSD